MKPSSNCDLKNWSSEYWKLLHGPYKGLNLFGHKKFEDFHTCQIIDTLFPLGSLEQLRKKFDQYQVIVDVGFGGGVPILPLAKEFPEKAFVGLERKQKKVLAVTDIAVKLGMRNVKVYHKSLEEVYFNQKVLIVSKAVASTIKILSWINGSIAPDLLLFKGPNLKKLEPSIKIAPWTSEQIFKYMIDDKFQRTLQYLSTPSLVPCGTNKYQEKLVKITQLH